MKLTTIFIIALCLFGSCANDSEKKNQISIMSFNIRYDEPNDGINNWIYRRQACVDMIVDQDPDVFGIQEGLIHQVNFMDSALKAYTFVGEGRDSLMKNNEYSAVFFKNAKFELLRAATFWLSETPEVASKGWDAKYNRIVTWVHLKDKQDGKELLVFNTHFDHRGEQARVESAKLIALKAQEISGDSLMTFVVGDLNTLPENDLLKPILTYMQSSQVMAPITDSMGTTNSFKVAQEGKIIDYVFYRLATPIQYQTIVKDYGVPYISDHYPVIAMFEY